MEFSQPAIGLRALDRGLVDQHDRNIIFYRVHPVTFYALQAFRILPVLEGLLARWANQNFK